MANHNVPGYVYLIYDPSARLYKIGLSRTPATRLRYLKQSYGSQLKILQACWTVNMLFVEQWLHEQFKLVRVDRGSMDGGTEWFQFDWWVVPYVKMSLISKCWLVIVGYVLGGVCAICLTILLLMFLWGVL